MGLIDSVLRALGSLRPLSDDELEDDHESLRQRFVSSDNMDKAESYLHEMRRYDSEMTRRANEAYARENPNPPEPRRREHGWYLSNDD